jgi:hypothetical protein
MAALIGRALCLPFEGLSRLCDCICSANIWTPCTSFFDYLCNSKASFCLFMTTAFAFFPGIAAFGYGFALYQSSSMCSMSDNASISSLSLNLWLVIQGGIGCAWLATACYVWIKFQRPFNPRDPRDVNWIARATYLMCYDPYIAIACLFGILQLAWLIIGAGMNTNFVRNSNTTCKDTILIAGFQGILATTWAFCILCVITFILVYLYECCCIGVEQMNNEINYVADGVLGVGRPQQQQQQQQQQQYYPEQQEYPYPVAQFQQQQQQHPAVNGGQLQYANYAIPNGPGAVPVAVPITFANNEAMVEQPTAVPMAVAVPAGAHGTQQQRVQYQQQQQQQQQQQHPILQNAAVLGMGLLTQGVRVGTAAARITATAATAAVHAIAHEVGNHNQSGASRTGQQRR